MSGGLTILGDTSGSIALVPATVAGSTTITLAAQSGTLNVAGPAFSAYAASGTGTVVPSGTYTKMLFNTEEYDTNNNFASSRFTPTVAGYYYISCGIYPGGASRATEVSLELYKNGAQHKIGVDTYNGCPFYILSSGWQVYFNGSTDYVEIYVFAATGSTFNTGAATTYFAGSLIRTA